MQSKIYKIDEIAHPTHPLKLHKHSPCSLSWRPIPQAPRLPPPARGPSEALPATYLHVYLLWNFIPHVTNASAFSAYMAIVDFFVIVVV